MEGKSSVSQRRSDMIAISEILADEIEVLRSRMYFIHGLTGTLTDRTLLKISKQLDLKINVQQQLMRPR
jgi:hypothetical protein